MNRPPRTAAPSGTLDAAGKMIQRRAAKWLARREAGQISAAEQAAFAAWLAADPRHAAIFAEVESSWSALDLLASYPRSEHVAPDPDLLAPARRARPAPWRPIALAAAAAIALGGALWLSRPGGGLASPAPVLAAQPAATQFRHLPDGSTVELNAGSVLTEHFTPTERRLRLVRGEAHFYVVKDPARAFIVEAEGVAVRAIGTAFNVRLGGEKVEVLVTEGTVGVGSHSQPLPAASAAPPPASLATLTAGQRTMIPAAAGLPLSPPVIETLATADIDRALAWQSHRLSFESTPLSEVVRRLNRFSAGQPGAPRLTIQDAPLGALLVSGRVRPDRIESFVEALETSFGVVAVRHDGGEIGMRQATPGKP